MSLRKAILYGLLLSTIIMASGWWGWRQIQQQWLSALNLSTTSAYFIKPGSSLQAIATDLHAHGWLDSPWYFILAARFFGMAKEIKAGEYAIEPGTNTLQLLEQFVEGKVVQYSLTLLEGWSYEQVMIALRNSDKIVQTLEGKDGQVVMAMLNRPELNPEAQFFPDTYHFPSGTTDIEFLQRAFERKEKILNEEWQCRQQGLPYTSSEEALIMASIIEKETYTNEERARIAGVFVLRLELGMRLQADPTVIYAMGKNYNGNIRRKDLLIDSPYNTYRYAGLPPSPIASAGLESIRAALHPEKSKSLYFVSKGDGTHHFSSTLKEHNRAVFRYQRRKKR